MGYLLSLFCVFALIVTLMQATHADEEIGAGDCMSLDCDGKEYKPVCGGLDADSATGYANECALQIYNCYHGTEYVVQTEVECEVAFSNSATGYRKP